MCSRIFSIISIFLLLSTAVLAQKVTTSKFGDISYEMTQQQVAVLNPDKLTVYDINNVDMPQHDIVVNGIKYHVIYYKNLKTKQFEVYTVSSVSAQLSTLSGIKIGSTLDDLWRNYKKYDISVQEVLEDDEIKSSRVFMINDLDNGCSLVFYLINNKVVKMELSNESGFINNNIYEN